MSYPGYGQNPQVPYGAPPGPQAAYPPQYPQQGAPPLGPRLLPSRSGPLTCGIIGIVLLFMSVPAGVILGPFAILGGRAMQREIRQGLRSPSERGAADAAVITGHIALWLSVCAVLLVLSFFGLIVAFAAA